MTWTIRNRYGYRYAKICIFTSVSLSNGRRLSYVKVTSATNIILKARIAYAALLWARRRARRGLLLLVVLLSPPCPNLINKIVSIENFNIATRITSIHHSGDSGFDRLLIVAKQNFNISGAIYFY